MTTYLYVVNSLGPHGPRAWSLSVEIPISAPSPSSPPSLKRVLALTSTTAVSTRAANLLAADSSEVMIASVCREPNRLMCSMASSMERTTPTEIFGPRNSVAKSDSVASPIPGSIWQVALSPSISTVLDRSCSAIRGSYSCARSL